jgi:hypothetical protein
MRILSSVALATITIGTMAGAQTPPPGGMPGTPADRAARWQAHRAEFEAMRRQRNDDIALLIGLRADQRPGLDAMLAAVEPHHGGRDHGGPDGKSPMGVPPGDESTTARIDQMSARIDENSVDEKAKLAAVRSFYATLSPDQRLRFDALDRLRHDRMVMHDGPGHDHHGGPGAPPPPPAG